MTQTSPDLASMFARYRQLSMFWQRAHCTPEIATQEMLEYCKLGPDIEDQIKRLTAFSELGTDAMFAAYAKAKAAPPNEEAGEGWRMILDGETIQEGDEYLNLNGEWRSHPSIGQAYSHKWADARRRIAKEPPKDTAGHIRADCEAKREETPVTAQETASKEVWRLLERGEVIQKGDQYADEDGDWRETNIHGCEYSTVFLPHRRRLTPPSDNQEPKLP